MRTPRGLLECGLLPFPRDDGAPNVLERPMTPSEKYFALVDATWPMNVIILADLDVCLDAEFVEETWRRYCAERSIPRLVTTDRLTLADTNGRPPEFEALALEPDDWDEAMSRESDIRYDDVPMRCRYYVSEATGSSRALIVGHHSIIDGRTGVDELQHFLRALDGQPVPALDGVPAPAPGRTHEWERDSRARIALLRRLRERRDEFDAPLPRDWPAASIPRKTRMRRVQLPGDTSEHLIAAARAESAGVLAAVAAAWLTATVPGLTDAPTGMLDLTTSVDLRDPAAENLDVAGLNVGVISNSFVVDPEQPWELARTIRRRTRESMAEGLGALFLQLARVAQVTDLEAGAATMAEAIAAVPPAFSSTNMGVVDPGTDPSWVRWITGHLAPSPNHLALAAGIGYRGQLIEYLATDDSRMTPEARAGIVDRFQHNLAAMIEAASV